MEGEELGLLIEKAINKAREAHNTRHIGNVITKLEEAKMWLSAHNDHLRAEAKRHGYTPTAT